jgi:polyribonucleotide nucleotidyltransferase
VIININPDKIRDVIGPGGKMIKQIVAQTGVKIDIDDDGRVHISSPTQPQADEAIKIIRDLTAEAEVGAIYHGKVKKIMDFGAFVEILPNTDGLVHISELAHHRVKAVTDILKEGDELMVKVLEVDRQGKIRLSRKALLEAEGPEGPRHHGKKPDRVSKKHSS